MNAKEMIVTEKSTREHWKGSLGFILAAAGSAIGLGNIWKFPYITGENGGAAFVLVYLFCIFLIGFPIMICEITLGRRTQKSPLGAFLEIAPHGSRTSRLTGILFLLLGLGFVCVGKEGLGVLLLLFGGSILYYGWSFVGFWFIISPFFIYTYYSTVGGWTIAYFFKGLSQQLNFETAQAAENVFLSFARDSYWPVFYELLFVTLCGLIVWFGIKNGIELISKILLPLLFLLVLVLIIRSLTLPGASKGITFLFSPDFSKLSPQSVLIALGHAFFSLSLGLGVMLTYGSYLDPDKSIFSMSLKIAGLDTLLALMAGLAIFPTIFAMGLDPETGPGLVFQTMPVTFNAIGDHLGWVWSSLFFLLLAIAAITSGISMLEVCVSSMIDEFKIPRHWATLSTSLVVGVLGVFCSLSVFDWNRFPQLEQFFIWAFGTPGSDSFQYKSFFDSLDMFSCNYLLPLGGLGISLFVGWIWGARYAVREIFQQTAISSDSSRQDAELVEKNPSDVSMNRTQKWLGTTWSVCIRFISPACIIITFLDLAGWFHSKAFLELWQRVLTIFS